MNSEAPNIIEDKSTFRDKVVDFEADMKEWESAFIGDNAHCPLKHTFSEGIYVREIFIPADTMLVGKIHKHDHPNFLMSGDVDVITESGGSERLKGPLSMISKAGTKRVVYTISDTVWITVHLNPTNTQDLSKLEEIVIADSYKEYERFIKSKDSFITKGINYIKNLLQ